MPDTKSLKNFKQDTWVTRITSLTYEFGIFTNVCIHLIIQMLVMLYSSILCLDIEEFILPICYVKDSSLTVFYSKTYAEGSCYLFCHDELSTLLKNYYTIMFAE